MRPGVAPEHDVGSRSGFVLIADEVDLQISTTAVVRNHFVLRWAVIVLVSIFCPTQHAWSEEAAYLARVFGEVRIDQKGANTGDRVASGSVVSVGKRGFAVLKFNDGQIVALRAASVFVVNEYAYRKDDSTEGRSHISLLRGGLRALTGLIGDQNQNAVSFNTPVATIGIRGTEFMVAVELETSDRTPRPPAQCIELFVKVEQDEVVMRYPKSGAIVSKKVRCAELTDEDLLRLVQAIRHASPEDLAVAVVAAGQVVALVNGQVKTDLKKDSSRDLDRVFEGLDEDLSQWISGEAGEAEQAPFGVVEEIVPLQATPGLLGRSGGVEATERPASGL